MRAYRYAKAWWRALVDAVTAWRRWERQMPYAMALADTVIIEPEDERLYVSTSASLQEATLSPRDHSTGVTDADTS